MAGAASPSPRPPLCRPRAGEEEEEEEGPPLPRAPRPAWQLSQHAPGHGQGAPSQHALGQPHSQHAPGHGQGSLSQHAPGHGQGAPSQHALGQPHSQHAPGHGQGSPSQHTPGHGQEAPSQHAPGHGQEAPSQHAPGHSQGSPSQHTPGHGQGAPSQHAPGQPHPHSAAVARRVLFADALGLPLTRLRRYQPWPPPSPESPPEVLPPAGQPPPAPYLLPAFVLPPPGQGEPERLARLRRAKVELEEVLAPGPGAPWLLRGIVRVLNVAYRKAVHVRASRDRWRTYRDHPARYVPGGSPDGGLSDRFAFSLPFGPTEEEEGEEEEEEEEGDEARLDFVIRYQTDEGIYWANNQGKNYRVVLKGVAPPWGRPRMAGRDSEGRHLRSCMRLGKMRPCEEEPSQEEAANPVGEEDGRLEREPLPGLPPAPAPQPPGQVAAHSLEKEPPTGEPPVPECPWGGRGPEAGELWQPEEEAVDQELEQLYVSHLSRLRAEQLWGAGGQGGDVEAAGPPPAWLPALRQDVLSDRDLVAHWAGPERALNSSLVQEITLRYASPPGPGEGEGVGRDSPPALLEGGVLSRLTASAAAVVVPARTAESLGRGPGAQRGPRGPWLGSQPREGAPGGPTRLGQALTHSLLIFGLMVVLPVVLSGCLPAAALALYALLTWRRVT